MQQKISGSFGAENMQEKMLTPLLHITKWLLLRNRCNEKFECTGKIRNSVEEKLFIGL